MPESVLDDGPKRKGRLPATQPRRGGASTPNASGFAGLSVKYPNFKSNVDHRYHTFLKAMVMGADACKTSSLTFNGPYAGISIGLGDWAALTYNLPKQAVKEISPPVFLLPRRNMRIAIFR